MALRAFEATNSSIDGHAINDNFVVVYNREIVQVNEQGCETPKNIETFEVDVHHFFAETISKGKKNDHHMHNISLDALVKHYQRIFREKMNVELKHILLWTDNAPHQYRCRQNFIKVLTVISRHEGINMTHRLAVVDNFKGVHDTVGKDPAFLVRGLELVGIRSKNAYQVFQNCTKCLTRTDDDTK